MDGSKYNNGEIKPVTLHFKLLKSTKVWEHVTREHMNIYVS